MWITLHIPPHGITVSGEVDGRNSGLRPSTITGSFVRITIGPSKEIARLSNCRLQTIYSTSRPWSTQSDLGNDEIPDEVVRIGYRIFMAGGGMELSQRAVECGASKQPRIFPFLRRAERTDLCWSASWVTTADIRLPLSPAQNDGSIERELPCVWVPCGARFSAQE